MESHVLVVATTDDGTTRALHAARTLAGPGTPIVLLVPHPASLDPDLLLNEPVGVEEAYRQLAKLENVDATVQVRPCKSPVDVLDGRGPSTIVIGDVRSWWPWPSAAQRLARALTKRGHDVRLVAVVLLMLVLATTAHAQTEPPDTPKRAAPISRAVLAQAPAPRPPLSYGGFVDIGALVSTEAPANELFRNRGTTPRVDEMDLNMATAYLRKAPSQQSRFGLELTAQAGEDAKLFGFSATAPNIGGANALLHLGPTNVSYLAPVAKGLTIQGGIFNSLIGYDSLYAKDNFAYTRPWGADYTPYLMLGVNASYPVTGKLTATAGVVNGYWHLADANSVPSVVGQAAYKLNDQITVKETVLYGPHQENTAIGLWRILSDTIVERKTNRLTTAFEYQFSGERVDAVDRPEALWMSAQLPVHWTLAGPASATVRPEIAWDSDGRWTGFPQRIIALTAGAEYRAKLGANGQAILRAEYRVDDSRGSGGGFFAGADNHLTPTQNLFAVALIVTFDGAIRR